MQILTYDHVGIRVCDATRSISFYRSMGFALDEDHSHERVAEMVPPAGVRVALIFNGIAAPTGENVLMDLAAKHPGITHAAFVVNRINDVIEWADAHQVMITEGPVDWGRRLTCFLRDPDGNVLEFNEIVDKG